MLAIHAMPGLTGLASSEPARTFPTNSTKRACALELVRISVITALDRLHRGLSLPAGNDLCVASSPGSSDFPEMRKGLQDSGFLVGPRSTPPWTPLEAIPHSTRVHLLDLRQAFSSEGRLTRHLTSIPAVQHPQAPPYQVSGQRCFQPVDATTSEVSEVLLTELRALPDDSPIDEAIIWAWVSEHIEPLSVLRETLALWRKETVSCAWKQEAAENVLLLLDPAVSAEVFPDDNPGPYDVPLYGDDLVVCFVSDGACLCISLPAPPPVSFSLTEPTSMPLRDARGLLCWAEATCKVFAECAAATRVGPVVLTCPDLWRPLPILKDWAEALGFCCQPSGMRSA